MNEKTNFDMSSLTLEELIKVFEDVEAFIKYLEDNKLDEGASK